VSDLEEKELIETVDQYIVVFTIEGGFVTVQVYNINNGDAVVGYMHFFYEPTKLIDDEELRKEVARTVVKLLPFFRKYSKIIGNVIEIRNLR
jgi:hypothetical protein